MAKAISGTPAGRRGGVWPSGRPPCGTPVSRRAAAVALLLTAAAGASPPPRPEAYSYATSKEGFKTFYFVVRPSDGSAGALRELSSTGSWIQDQNYTVACDSSDAGTLYRTAYSGSVGPYPRRRRNLPVFDERSPRTICVVAAASPQPVSVESDESSLRTTSASSPRPVSVECLGRTEYPRRSRGIAVACLCGMTTSRRASSQVRRRRFDRRVLPRAV